MKKFLIAMFAIILIPFAVFAHEGHGSTDGFTITHYFVEPEHAVYTWSLLIVGALLISYYGVKRRRPSK